MAKLYIIIYLYYFWIPISTIGTYIIIIYAISKCSKRRFTPGHSTAVSRHIIYNILIALCLFIYFVLFFLSNNTILIIMRINPDPNVIITIIFCGQSPRTTTLCYEKTLHGCGGGWHGTPAVSAARDNLCRQ